MDKSNFTVINGLKTMKDDYPIKCYESVLESVKEYTLSELFEGFNTIKVITFSYNLDFMDELLQHFDYAEILLGADFLVTKNFDLQALCAHIETSQKELKKYPHLIAMMETESLVIRTPTYVLNHSKIYLLKADDGRTRVIRTSANISEPAFSGNHMEHFDVYNDLYAYEESEKDFETAWEDSQEIPYYCIPLNLKEDPMENPVITRVKEVGQLVVQIPQKDTIDKIKQTKYLLDVEDNLEKYNEIFKGINTNPKKGLIEIKPKQITRMESNFKTFLKQKLEVKQELKEYPVIDFNFAMRTATLNKEPMDLNPSKEDICEDINKFLQLFDNYDNFKGDIVTLKETQFKIFNAIFCSPFNAPVRKLAEVLDIATMSIPMFLMITSKTANSGKTFACKTAIKMMTGADIDDRYASACNKQFYQGCMASDYSTPIFIDELNNTISSRSVKDLIKTEGTFSDRQPMIIFAGNSLKEPDEIIRKRSLFLPINNVVLPSNIDQNSYKNRGNNLRKSFGTAFYREYFRRMLIKIDEMMYVMQDRKNQDLGDYPDILGKSSEAMIEIFREFDYEIPAWMKQLSWYNDYSVNAKFVSEDAFRDILNEYKKNPKSFTIDSDSVTIKLGSDKKSKELTETWQNVLPAELMAQCRYGYDGCASITMNRQELEDAIGFKFKNPWKFPFFGKD